MLSGRVKQGRFASQATPSRGGLRRAHLDPRADSTAPWPTPRLSPRGYATSSALPHAALDPRPARARQWKSHRATPRPPALLAAEGPARSACQRRCPRARGAADSRTPPRTPRCRSAARRKRSPPFFFPPSESPLDAARVDLASETLLDSPCQLERAQGRIQRALLLHEVHHFGAQLVRPARPRFLRHQSRQSTALEERASLLEGGTREAERDPLLTPALPAFDEVDVLPELGMKRVRDPHRCGHLIGARCS